MSRTKKNKLNQHQKVVIHCLLSGQPVTKEQIVEKLGNEIYPYRISTYMYEIKTFMNGIIRVQKDGRKVISYQLINIDEIKQYLRRAGIFDADCNMRQQYVLSLNELKVNGIINDEVEA